MYERKFDSSRVVDNTLILSLGSLSPEGKKWVEKQELKSSFKKDYLYDHRLEENIIHISRIV